MKDSLLKELLERYKTVKADEGGMTRALHERGDGSDYDLSALLKAVEAILVEEGLLTGDED
jgi:hypothetical protein